MNIIINIIIFNIGNIIFTNNNNDNDNNNIHNKNNSNEYIIIKLMLE